MSRALPEDPWSYFVATDDTIMVRVADIAPSRARPGGIERAGELMLAAHRGEVARRKPVSLCDNGDGTYTLLDGNSTYANALASGWELLPGIVEQVGDCPQPMRRNMQCPHCREHTDRYWTSWDIPGEGYACPKCEGQARKIDLDDGISVPRYAAHRPPWKYDLSKGLKAYPPAASAERSGEARAIRQAFPKGAVKEKGILWLAPIRPGDPQSWKPYLKHERGVTVDLAKLDPENLQYSWGAEGYVWHLGDIPREAITLDWLTKRNPRNPPQQESTTIWPRDRPEAIAHQEKQRRGNPLAPYKLEVEGDAPGATLAQALARGVEKASDICKITPPVCVGNLGVPRDQMPQLREAVIPAYLESLESQGHHVHKATVPVGHLQATQREINANKVLGMLENFRAGRFPSITAPVIVSTEADGSHHILDGHHRWATLLVDAPQNEMEVHLVSAPIRELLLQADLFEGVTQEAF